MPAIGNRTQYVQEARCSNRSAYVKETLMLSPHELATLMLIKDAIDPAELDPADFKTLLEQQFATREQRAPGCHRALITINGHAFLKAIQRQESGGCLR